MGAYNHVVENAFLTLVNCSHSDGQIRPAVLDLSRNPTLSENIVLKKAIEAGLRHNDIEIRYKDDYYSVRSQLIEHYNEREEENKESNMEKDKFADLKEAYAMGAEIEFLSHADDKWCDVCGVPCWGDTYKYRVKPEKVEHVHQDIINAYKRGAQIEYFDKDDGTWWPASTPTWSLCKEYRVKPETDGSEFDSGKIVDNLFKTGILYSRICSWYHKYNGAKISLDTFDYNLRDSCQIITVYGLTGHELVVVRLEVFRRLNESFDDDKPETATFKHKEYSLGFGATKQAIDDIIGETKMNFDNKAVEAKFDLFGVPSDELTDSAIFGIIKKLEDQIAKHDEIKAKPAKLKAEITKLEGQIKELVAFVDNRD